MAAIDVALKALTTAPTMQFQNLNTTPLFKTTRFPRNGVVYLGLKVSKPVSDDSFFLRPSVQIQFASMQLVEAKGLFFGFLFTLPFDCEIGVFRNRATIVKRRVDDYTNVEARYQDSFLNVFSAPQGALLLTTNRIELFDTNIVRERRISRGD